MKRLIRLYDGLIAALAWFAGVAVVVIFVLILLDVTVREVVGDSLNFTIGVVEYLLLYFTMFAAPYLVRTRGHVYIEAVISNVNDRVRRVLEIVSYVVCALATGLIGTVAFILLLEKIESGTIDIRGIDFPSWIVVAPLPLCYGLVAIEFLRFLFGRDSMYRRDSAAPDSL